MQISIDHANAVCRLLGDRSRVRLLALLAAEELTVSELTRITGLSQSRVSSHLSRLKAAALVVARREKAESFYRAQRGDGPSSALWRLLAPTLADPLLETDRAMAETLVQARNADLGWADTVAGAMERHYSPGRTWESSARGLLGFAQLGRVVDIASGDGALAELLLPHSAHVTCVDKSPRVVEVGANRFGGEPHLEFVEGDMGALPFEDGQFDDALLMNALTYADAPREALAEAARVLVPGGRLVGTTLLAHEHRDAVVPFDHVHLGFSISDLSSWLTAAGFAIERCAISHRERRAPHFQIITFHAVKADQSRDLQ